MQTIGEIIKGKDYDYVSYRGLIDGESIYCGCFNVVNGEIKSLDGDLYSKDEHVVLYEEWSEPEMGINNGLTIVVPIA